MHSSSLTTHTSPKVLVIDVGNSSTSLGIYCDGKILQQVRLETRTLKYRKSCEHIRAFIGSITPNGAALASVAPHVNEPLTKAIRSVCKIPTLRVHHTLKLGADITYPDPETIGEDRLANLAGASSRYALPAIVVDIGTATTFDIIEKRAGYTGGIIAPGPALMLEYLAERTSLLPRIDLTPVNATLGKTTEEAMRLGALHGYRGMVKEITHYLMRRLRKRTISLCATGGYARWVLQGMELPFIYDRDLTLYGVGRIFEKNTTS